MLEFSLSNIWIIHIINNQIEIIKILKFLTFCTVLLLHGHYYSIINGENKL